MTSHDQIVTRLLDIARQRFGESARTLTAGDDLYEVLGIDSMQAMDLLTDLEEAFDIAIPDYEMQGVRTLASIAGIITRLL